MNVAIALGLALAGILTGIFGIASGRKWVVYVAIFIWVAGAVVALIT